MGFVFDVGSCGFSRSMVGVVVSFHGRRGQPICPAGVKDPRQICRPHPVSVRSARAWIMMWRNCIGGGGSVGSAGKCLADGYVGHVGSDESLVRATCRFPLD
jgi:hypothetical protein